MENWIENACDPFTLFENWFESAQPHNFEPTAMTLATLGEDEMPSARVVLLKKYDENGFCFFTNYQSRKAVELDAHPKAALVFHWQKPSHRQIRVQGLIQKLSYEESNAYFQTRTRGSQIGAWASPQSQEISSREELQKRVQEIEERFEGKDIPCPEFWGGFRVQPLCMEFWQSQDHRLHDRKRFQRHNLNSDWSSKRLAP